MEAPPRSRAPLVAAPAGSVQTLERLIKYFYNLVKIINLTTNLRLLSNTGQMWHPVVTVVVVGVVVRRATARMM
jgi:hypothetical protein